MMFFSADPYPNKVAVLSRRPRADQPVPQLYTHCDYLGEKDQVRARHKNVGQRVAQVAIPRLEYVKRAAEYFGVSGKDFRSAALIKSLDDVDIEPNDPRTYYVLGMGWGTTKYTHLAMREDGLCFQIPQELFFALSVKGLISTTGRIKEKCVWGFNYMDRVLVPLNTKLYADLVYSVRKKEADRRWQHEAREMLRTPKKDLVVGGVYRVAMGRFDDNGRPIYYEAAVYLGHIRKKGAKYARHALLSETRLGARENLAWVQDWYKGPAANYTIRYDPILYEYRGTIDPGIVYDPRRSLFNGQGKELDPADWCWEDVATLGGRLSHSRFSVVL